jgi:predicted amidohydrolase
MSNLKVTIIQSDLKWQDIDHNLAHFEAILLPLKNTTDIIVLPEMFTTAFSMRPELLAEPINGKSVQWMIQMAQHTSAAICGSLIIQEEKKGARQYFNRFVWAQPDGTIITYNKHHLFNLVEENKHFEAGNEQVIIPFKGWKIQPFICYDLRFPVWCRNTSNADLQIYVANWPTKRSEHWKVLLKARAIENQCFVVGVNRIGNDNNAVYHSGDSSIYNFAGENLFTVADHFAVHTETLSLQELSTYRARYPFLADKDHFTIH